MRRHGGRQTTGGTISMTLMPVKYVQRYRVDGRWFTYYRRGKVRVRLPGEPGDAAWQAAYDAAAARYAADQAKPTPGPELPAPRSHPPGSIGALIASYRRTTAYAALTEASIRDYAKGLGWLEAHHAHRPVATMTRPHVIKLREQAAWRTDPATGARSMVPSRANKVLTMLSILLEHACDIGWRTDNPAIGVAKLRAAADGGYRAWTDAEVATFLAHAEPFWRLAATLALWTGQRGQDLVAMRWRDYDGRRITLRQAKTGNELTIPLHALARAALDAAPRDGEFILMRPDRRLAKPGVVRPPQPWSVNHFQHAAGEAIRAAGLFGVVWHGLRATAATKLAERGSPDAEIMAITGHKTGRMAAHYRRGADQAALARAAIGRLERPRLSNRPKR